MKWMHTAVLLFDYIGGTVLVYLAFQAYPDHSGPALLQWGLFYFVAVVQPIGWALYHTRMLKRLGLVMDRSLSTYAFAPMIIGALTLLTALRLIEGP